MSKIDERTVDSKISDDLCTHIWLCLNLHFVEYITDSHMRIIKKLQTYCEGLFMKRLCYDFGKAAIYYV